MKNIQQSMTSPYFLKSHLIQLFRILYKGITMKYLRVKKAADFLNCSVSHVWNLVKAGELTTIKLSPRVTVFSIDILEAYVSSKVA